MARPGPHQHDPQGRPLQSEQAAIPTKTSRRMNTKRRQIMCKQRGR